jgi:hypothetical protein
MHAATKLRSWFGSSSHRNFPKSRYGTTISNFATNEFAGDGKVVVGKETYFITVSKMANLGRHGGETHFQVPTGDRRPEKRRLPGGRTEVTDETNGDQLTVDRFGKAVEISATGLHFELPAAGKWKSRFLTSNRPPSGTVDVYIVTMVRSRWMRLIEAASGSVEGSEVGATSPARQRFRKFRDRHAAGCP